LGSATFSNNTVATLEDAHAQAANCYEQLTLQQPEEEDYKVYYAQSLYAASLYQEAMKVTVTVEGPDHQAAMLKLQAAIKWVQKRRNKKEFSIQQCLSRSIL
jgi:tetratricopeptide repeat protein 30